MLRGPFTDRGLQHLRGLDGLFALNLDDARLAITAAVPRRRCARCRISAGSRWTPRTTGCRTSRRCRAALSRRAGHDRRRRRLRRAEPVASRSSTSGDAAATTCGAAGFIALADDAGAARAVGELPERRRRRLAALPRFPALRELMPMDVPDAGYRHVGRCATLESLILMYCRDTTDAATEHITGLSKLIVLLQQLHDDHRSHAGAAVDDGLARAHHVRHVPRPDGRRRRAAGPAAAAARAARRRAAA